VRRLILRLAQACRGAGSWPIGFPSEDRVGSSAVSSAGAGSRMRRAFQIKPPGQVCASASSGARAAPVESKRPRGMRRLASHLGHTACLKLDHNAAPPASTSSHAALTVLREAVRSNGGSLSPERFCAHLNTVLNFAAKLHPSRGCGARLPGPSVVAAPVRSRIGRRV